MLSRDQVAKAWEEARARRSARIVNELERHWPFVIDASIWDLHKVPDFHYTDVHNWLDEHGGDGSWDRHPDHALIIGMNDAELAVHFTLRWR